MVTLKAIKESNAAFWLPKKFEGYKQIKLDDLMGAKFTNPEPAIIRRTPVLDSNGEQKKSPRTGALYWDEVAYIPVKIQDGITRIYYTSSPHILNILRRIDGDVFDDPEHPTSQLVILREIIEDKMKVVMKPYDYGSKGQLPAAALIEAD